METFWTDERFAQLDELWAAGYSAAVIAEKLGTTRNSVIGKARRSNLESRAKSPNGHRDPVDPKYKRKYVRQLTVYGKHREMSTVRLQAAPVKVIDSEIPTKQRRTLLKLRDWQCKYPVGEVGEPGFFFCAASAMEGSVYCAAHHRRCYQPGSRSNRHTNFRLAHG